MSEIDRTSPGSKAFAILRLCLGLCAILGAACVAFLFIAGFVLGIDAFFHHWAKTPSLFAALQSPRSANSGLYFGLTLSFLIYTSLAAAVIVVARLQGGSDWRGTIAWRPWRPERKVWLIVAATVAYGFSADFALSKFSPGSSAHLAMPDNFGAAVAFSVLAVIFAPVAEELVFRGWIFTRLRQNFSFLTTLLLTSAVFAALHYESTHFYALAIFPVGLALGAIRETTGSVKPAIAFHAFNNLIACGLSLLD